MYSVPTRSFITETPSPLWNQSHMSILLLSPPPVPKIHPSTLYPLPMLMNKVKYTIPRIEKTCFTPSNARCVHHTGTWAGSVSIIPLKNPRLGFKPTPLTFPIPSISSYHLLCATLTSFHPLSVDAFSFFLNFSLCSFPHGPPKTHTHWVSFVQHSCPRYFCALAQFPFFRFTPPPPVAPVSSCSPPPFQLIQSLSFIIFF